MGGRERDREGHMPGRLRRQRQRHASWMPLVSKPCHTGHRVGTPSTLHCVRGAGAGGGALYTLRRSQRVCICQAKVDEGVADITKVVAGENKGAWMG